MTRLLNFKNIIVALYVTTIFLFLCTFFNRASFVTKNIETLNIQQASIAATFLLFTLILYYLIFKYGVEFKRKYIAIVLVLMILITFSLPIFSVDIGSYLTAAKNMVIHSVNPYHLPLNYFNDDPWVKYMGSTWWMNYPSLYGPVALILASIAVLVSAQSFYLAIFAYKLLVLISIILSAYLFGKLDSSKNRAASLLFLLNPILLLNVLLDGHNDAFVLLSLLGFLYFLKKGNNIKSYLSLLPGIFIKYSSLILLPAYFIQDRKIRWGRAIISIFIVGVIFYCFFQIFHFSIESYFSNNALIIFKQCTYVCTPFVYLTSRLFTNNAGIIRLALFILAYAAVIFKYLLHSSQPYKFVFWSLIALFFIGSTTYVPWYSIGPIAAGLLISERKYYILVILLTAYSLLFFFGL